MKTGTEFTRTSPSIPIAVATVRTVLSAILSSMVVLNAPGTAASQAIVAASPDVTIDLGASVIVADQDLAVDDPVGIVVLENLGALPDASEMIALGLDVNGGRFVAFETTTVRTDGVEARRGDVVLYDGATYSIEFDASAAADLDAVRVPEPGWVGLLGAGCALLFGFDGRRLSRHHPATATWKSRRGLREKNRTERG